jgi:hypothetical protein
MSNSLNGVIIDAARRRLLDDWAIIQRWTSGSAPNTLTQALSLTSLPGSTTVNACCLLPNGNVIFICDQLFSFFFIYNPTANTITLPPNYSLGASPFYKWVGTENDDHVIFLAPDQNSVITKYNYVTDTFVSTSGTALSNNGFAKGKNKLFYTVPRYADKIQIYTPTTSSIVNGPLHGYGSVSFSTNGAFWSGVSTPYGTIVYIPSEATTIGIYNIASNTFSNSSYTGPISNMFKSGCLAPNGKIILAPHGWSSVDKVGIYDPITDTFQLGASTQTNVNYRQAVLTPSGKIVFIPQSLRVPAVPGVSSQYLTAGGDFGIYDPFTDTFSVSALNPYSVTNPFGGASLMPNGKVIFGVTASSSVRNVSVFEGGADVIDSHEKATLGYLLTNSAPVFGY